LQAGGEVRRFTDDRLFLRRSFANQIADNHQPGGNPNARLEPDGFDIEATDSVDRAEPRSHRPLGIVLMRSRVAEINQHPVAHEFSDKAIVLADTLIHGSVIGADHLSQVFRIEPRGQRRRAHKIAEHHRELAALSPIGARWRPSSCRRWTGDLADGLAATTAELGSGLVLEAAGRAGRRQWHPALGAKAPGRCVFRHALWAAHMVPLRRANRSARR